MFWQLDLVRGGPPQHPRALEFILSKPAAFIASFSGAKPSPALIMTNPHHVVSMSASNEGCLTENCTKCLPSTRQGERDGCGEKQKRNYTKKRKTATQINMQLPLSGSIYFRTGSFKMKPCLMIISRGRTQRNWECCFSLDLTRVAFLIRK